jgi:type IV secretion system protein TrbI
VEARPSDSGVRLDRLLTSHRSPRVTRGGRKKYMPEIENDEPRSRPVLRNPAGKPTGVLPRNAQTIMIIAISAVMIAAIAFSGTGTKPTAKTAPLPAAGVTDPNQARIAEYRSRLDEEARKLAAEQAQVLEARRQFSDATANPAQANGALPPGRTDPSSSATEENNIDNDRRRRAYLSLFASNVALTYRRTNLGQISETTSPDLNPPPANAGSPPSLPVPLARDSQAGRAAGPPGRPASQDADFAAGGAEVSPKPGATLVAEPETSARKVQQDQDAELTRSRGTKYRVFEGTVLEAVLTNRLNGSFSGPVNCMLTTNVYSHDRQHLLIPQGTRVLGEVKRVTVLGQERLAVFFHRLVMPDGYSLSLDKFEGLNQIGETGLRDQVNHHYGQVFGMSLAIGAIAGFAQANNNSGVFQSSTDAYREGVASNLSQSSLHVLDHYLNILPTVTIREGHRIKIYFAGDLLVPSFENHVMPEDI